MSIKLKTLVLFLFASVSLFSQGYYIENYDVQMQLQEDGSLDVSENIKVHYTEKRQGIIRDIPYIYSWQGKRTQVKISNISVPGYKQSVSNKGSEKSIRIGTAGKYLQGEQDYQIKYTVKGHIAAYEDFLELYWNAIPEGWDTRIESYSYSLTLPKDVNLDFQDYRILSGDQGSKDNTATLQYQGNTISGRGTIPLKANQGVTIAVKLPYDYIPADLIAESAQEIQSNRKPINQDPWTWIVSLFGIVMFWFGWRNIDGNGTDDKNINIQHYPPENMSAAQVGHFIDHKANTRDIMALIPQWGAEGLIKLEKVEDDTQIIKIGDLPKELPIYEHTLFEGIFEAGDVVYLNALKYKIASPLYNSCHQLSVDQKKSDLYDENSVTYFHSWKTIVASSFFLIICALSLIIWQTVIIGIALGLIGIALFIIYFMEPKYSQTGIRIKNHLLGLEQFLKNHDGTDYPELMRKDPKYFDKIFPYAVALGIDTNFLKYFGNHVDYAPNWYGYHNGLGMNMIAGSSMRSFSKNFDVKEISSVFTAVKSPEGGGSGGGGFSGGGSVGGGFGGGGGSSW